MADKSKKFHMAAVRLCGKGLCNNVCVITLKIKNLKESVGVSSQNETPIRDCDKVRLYNVSV